MDIRFDWLKAAFFYGGSCRAGHRLRRRRTDRFSDDAHGVMRSRDV